MPVTPPYTIIDFSALPDFVGQIITRYLFDQYGVGGPIKWAIAGRSETKLLALQTDLGPSARQLR